MFNVIRSIAGLVCINTQMDPEVMKSAEWENTRDRLVLEIQRSLDYYESQMGKGQVTKIFIAQRQFDTQDMVKVLDESLTAQVTSMNMADRMQSDVTLTPETQQIASLAIGATLRGMKREELTVPSPDAPEPSPEDTTDQEAA